MARFLTKAISLISVLLLACWTCSTSALSLEDKTFQKLIEKFEIVEAKVIYLEKENSRLKETVTQLKIKIEQQDSILKDLQHLRQTNRGSKLSTRNIALENSFNGKSAAIPRTCREARLSNPALTSGMYWIDPDGQGVGDDPISVFCDMISGSTSVLHDSELPTDVGHCEEPGCYSKAINYNSSIRQMAALAEISDECHQSIKYDCNFAPFEVNGVTYSWWNDRTGNPRYFWSGSNSSVHVCQCGIDHNCIETFMPCNCDSGVPTPLSDDGIISDKNNLPITRLNFGRTAFPSSSGVYTLGRFECTGQIGINGMPSSCEDLWRIGHTLSGLYSVMGIAKVENIYCDFTKLPSDTGFEKWIGYADVKSVPTYFYVQRNTPFYTTNVAIPFEIVRLNIGGAFDLSSGIFTAPRSGTYFFSFIGFPVFLESSSIVQIIVGLFLNGNQIGVGESQQQANSLTAENEQLSLQSTLNLKAGDKIWLEIIRTTGAGEFLYDAGGWNHFSGWLLEEEFSMSL